MSSLPGGSVAERLTALRGRIAAAALGAGRPADSVRLVAVSKYASPEQVLEAYAAGQREFGESRIQSALPRIDALPADVVWHLVGHLQGNKVNKVLGRFELIHSVDSWELASRLSDRSQSRELLSQILVQVNCSGEMSKSGIPPEEAESLLLSLRELRGIMVRGLMTMAPLDGGAEATRASFRRLAGIRDKVMALDHPELALDQLSMGMTGDFEVAIEEGATIIRVGSAIFGEG
jgi:PLP dependent protein